MEISLNNWPLPNLTSVTVNDLSLWFSYETVVAFVFEGDLVVSENRWGPTTAKHLKYIDGGAADEKAARLPAEAFDAALAKATSK
jgi:hypothetical protein